MTSQKIHAQLMHRLRNVVGRTFAATSAYSRTTRGGAFFVGTMSDLSLAMLFIGSP